MRSILLLSLLLISHPLVSQNRPQQYYPRPPGSYIFKSTGPDYTESIEYEKEIQQNQNMTQTPEAPAQRAVPMRRSPATPPGYYFHQHVPNSNYTPLDYPHPYARPYGYSYRYSNFYRPQINPSSPGVYPRAGDREELYLFSH